MLFNSYYTNGKDRGYQSRDLEWSKDFEEFAAAHPDGVQQTYLQSMVDALDRFLADRRREGITVVLVYSPEYFKALDMIKNREEIFSIYRRLASKYQVAFLDYSYDAMSYDTKYFYNSQHLNKTGAELFSARLAGTLTSLVAPAEVAVKQGLR